ncbi:MAG: OmpA family protein [Cytophagaceae bacterium]
MRYLFYGLILFCLTFNVQAQERNIKNLSPEKKSRLADELMAKKSFYNSVDYLKDLVDEHPTNKKYVFQLGQAYFFSRDYLNAEVWLEKTVKMDGISVSKALFWYAETLKYNGKYEQAKEMFDKFAKSKYREERGERFKRFAENEVISCQFAIDNFEKENGALIEHTGPEINSKYSEFAPVILDDTIMFFATLRADTVLVVEPEDINPHRVRLNKSVWSGDAWQPASELPSTINSKFDNAANGVFSLDRSKFYFTRCTPDRSYRMTCALWVSEYHDGKFQKPEKLPAKINRKGCTTTQPAIGKAQVGRVELEVLYFVSDRKGGYGGRDIWLSVIDSKGRFRNPQNLGKVINTMRDEISPYYDVNTNTLYFSSNFHPGFGGFDIFSAVGQLNRVDLPENIGRPLNSRVDDTYMIYNSEKRKGYFVSNRPEGYHLTSETCCDDIYSYEYLNPYILQVEAKVKGDTTDAAKPYVQIFQNVGDINLTAELKQAKMDSSKAVLYTFFDMLQGIPTDTLSLVKKFNEFPYSERESLNNHYRLKNNTEYLAVVTNSFDTAVYSFRTGEKPSVKDYFKADSISEHRYVKEEDIYRMHLSFVLKGKEQEPKKDTTFTAADKKEYTVSRLVDKMRSNSSSELKVILNYDFDDTKFIEKNSGSLDSLIALINEFPEVKVKIDAHTDNFGTHEYNLRLSDKRAKAILNYMVSKGVNPKRVTTKGHAATKPLVPNSNPDGSDNPDNRWLNRRAEITLYTDDKELSK